MNRPLAAIFILLGIAACTSADQARVTAFEATAAPVAREACALDQAGQPIIVPAEVALGAGFLPAAPFIAGGHIAAGVGCAVILAVPASP